MDKGKVYILIIFAIILRLILSAVTFHSDIVHFDLAGFSLSQTNVVNFYDYTVTDPQTGESYPGIIFNYPPLVYLTLGPLALIFSNLMQVDFYHNFLFETQKIFGSWQVFFHLLTLKLPYIFFDIAIAFLLTKFFDMKREKILAFSLWLFNPVSLYATYMMGQFDIIPTFFVILSLYLVYKQEITEKRLFISALLLGLGAAFKIYPLFFLIPLASLTPNWFYRLKIILAGLIPYILTVLPFLPSTGFREKGLVAAQVSKSLYANIPISGGETIIIFLAFLIFFYILLLQRSNKKEFLWSWFLVPLILFFSLTHYHPQWFLWITPFLIIDLVKSGFKHWLLVSLALFSWLGLIFFFETGLNISLFAPIWTSLYNNPTVWQLLGMNIDYNFARSILQTIFVGVAIYYLYLYFPRERDN